MAHNHDHDGNHGFRGRHRHGSGRPSRRQVIGRATAAGLVLPLSRLAWAATPEVAGDMSRAVRAWLGQLDERQRAGAQLAWSTRRLEDWHYVPRSRAGVPLRQMTQAQTAAAWDVL